MYYCDYAKYGALTAEVYAVGWLCATEPRSMGSVHPDIVAKLLRLREQFHANQTRGIHSCPFCLTEDYYPMLGRRVFLGSAEIWVPDAARSKIFACPDLIIHYMFEHHYLPPQDFLDAVAAFQSDSGWEAETVVRKLEARGEYVDYFLGGEQRR